MSSSALLQLENIVKNYVAIIDRLPGVYAGALLLSAIQTAINLMGLPARYTEMILGGLVLAAVLLDTVKLQIRQKMA
jgi:ribose transport system permease protein